MTANTKSAQERAASIDLAQLDKIEAEAKAIPGYLDRDYKSCVREAVSDILEAVNLARRSLTSGAPALVQALEVGDERESSKWFEIHPSEVPFYKDEGYSIRELYVAQVHDAAAKTEQAPIPDAWKLLLAGLIREMEQTYKLIEQRAPEIEVTIGQFRRLRAAKEMLRDAGIPEITVEGLDHE